MDRRSGKDRRQVGDPHNNKDLDKINGIERRGRIDRMKIG